MKNVILQLAIFSVSLSIFHYFIWQNKSVFLNPSCWIAIPLKKQVQHWLAWGLIAPKLQVACITHTLSFLSFFSLSPSPHSLYCLKVSFTHFVIRSKHSLNLIRVFQMEFFSSSLSILLKKLYRYPVTLYFN